ncbi:2-dehydro-3-deoxygluconokinase [Crossiella equi]|uniref:2-dehydro-3-deoxygluconokinase n=2 Tax=Crossiella equi TaxID=130796 RepID=A0ABS5AC73_9PSEU|nr:sugar kinase [Crossiella equi]MBP2473305.1 2-dehydro-3-deoxygluconokinase [Crossiella equi]
MDERKAQVDRAGADVVCLGESMALFVPAEPGPTHEVTTWTRTVGGAESNVACHLARLGWHSRWVSALGQDAFGQAILDRIGSFGVDVRDVSRDEHRPTGLYVKEASAGGSTVRYFRRGSAASGMGPELLDGLNLDRTALIHVSGITAALSDSCLALLTAILDPWRGDRLVSFDLNWRPALWRGKDTSVLAELANKADIVLVGSDEAEALWGVGDPEGLRALLPEPRTLVVKQAEHGATLVENGGTHFEPALKVEVVEPVGAGDAFAAGYLSAHLDGLPPAQRLRQGHLTAVGSLLTRDDVGDPVPEARRAELLAAAAETWAATHFTAGALA